MERELEPLALRALVERDEQMQARRVDEGQLAQIEQQAWVADAVQYALQRLRGREVQLAAWPHDRHVIVVLDLDVERLGHDRFGRPAMPIQL